MIGRLLAAAGRLLARLCPCEDHEPAAPLCWGCGLDCPETPCDSNLHSFCTVTCDCTCHDEAGA